MSDIVRTSPCAGGLGRGLAAINQIDTIVRDENIDCDFAWIPGYLHAPRYPSRQKGKIDFEAEATLVADLGFDATFERDVPFMGGPGDRALTTPRPAIHNHIPHFQESPMKLTIVALLVLLGLAAAASDAAAQSSPMRPGRWEVTMQMEMPGMPMQMPPMKDTRCITQQQLDSPDRGLPSGPLKNPNACKVSDYKASGNSVSWSMACSGPPASSGTGELLFDGDTYTGTVKMTMDQKPITMKMSGKRLGDCTQ